MRTAPAVHVVVAGFGVWRVGVCSMLLLVWGVLAAWMGMHWRAQGPSMATVLAVAGSAAAVSAAFAGRLLAVRPFSLRWDGRCWHLSPSVRPDIEAVPGEIHAAIDLGRWLLLRFEPERRGAARWLPVQHPGLEASWHSLRCAVFSPRVASGVLDADVG